MPRKPTALVLICLLSAACTSNQYLVRPDAANASPRQETVFVTNQENARPFAILQQSNLYTLTDSERAPNHLRLLRLDRGMSCGMPLLALVVFLGVLPVSLENNYHFSYRLQEGGDVQTYVHDIRIKTRLSIWEWAAKPFTDSQDELLAEGLALSTRRVVTERDWLRE